MVDSFEPADVDGLFSAAYEELRRLAARVRRNPGADTLNPTALVNEAYVKLRSSLGIRPASRLHFRRIAARAMRQVLVEAARRRVSLKRGGDLCFVTFDEERDAWSARAESVLALHEALEELALIEPRQAALVEFRFFGGFEGRETADLLGVSLATVDRDWRAARAWLSARVRRGPAPPRDGDPPLASR